MDELVQLVMKDLLKEDKFKKLWVDLAMEIEDSIETEAKNQPKKVSIKTSTPSIYNLPISNCLSTLPPSNFCSNLSKTDKTFTKIYNQIADGLELATKNFCRGIQLAYYSTDKTKNNYFRHEASSLYSIQIMLERSIISNKLNINQFGLIARRIIKIQQLFGAFTSIPYNVEHCTFMASTLYVIHTRFFEYGNSFDIENNCNEAKNNLNDAIELFGKFVCQRLDKMLTSLLNKQKVLSTESQPFVNYIKNQLDDSTSPTHNKMLLTCFQGWNPTRRKGFLLSPDLEYSKAKIALAKKYRSNSTERCSKHF